MAISRSQIAKELKPGLGRNWKRNPHAQSLESRRYGCKVIKSKKLYNRKKEKLYASKAAAKKETDNAING